MSNINGFTSYDRISDFLLYFTPEVSLKFVVVLSRNTKTGERRFFHYEVEKQPNTRNGIVTRNINRNMNFFFTIDNKNDFTSTFVIRPQDAEMLVKVIEEKVLPWYYSESPLYAFQYKNDELLLTEYTPVIYTQSDIKYLKFTPSILTEKDLFVHAIKINVNGLFEFDIELEKLMGLVYFLKADMYSAACAMVNYVKIEPYGVEVFRPSGLGGGHIDDNWGPIQSEYTSTNVSGRNANNDRKSGRNNFLDNL